MLFVGQVGQVSSSAAVKINRTVVAADGILCSRRSVLICNLHAVVTEHN